MKKLLKTLSLIILLVIIVPAGAGYGIMLLWNWLLPAILGCSVINLWQGVGMFLLGQLLSAGFVLGAFIIGGSLHAVGHRHKHGHWQKMTKEERRDFFERRRQWFEMTHPSRQSPEND